MSDKSSRVWVGNREYTYTPVEDPTTAVPLTPILPDLAEVEWNPRADLIIIDDAGYIKPKAPTPAEKVANLLKRLTRAEGWIETAKEIIEDEKLSIIRFYKIITEIQTELELLTQQEGKDCPHMPITNSDGITFVL